MKYVFALFFPILSLSSCARILGVMPIPSYSHQIVFQPLWKELSLRGHQVTTLTTDLINEPNLVNLTEIDLSFIYDIWTRDLRKIIILNQKSFFYGFAGAIRSMINILDKELQNPQVQKLLNDKSSKFDLVMAEYAIPGMFAFATRFNCPLILLSSLDPTSFGYEFIGNPIHPAFDTDVMRPYEEKYTLFGRLKSVLHFLFVKALNTFSYFPANDAFIKKNFGDGYPPVLSIGNNASAFFVNANTVFQKILPLFPNVVQIGGKLHRNDTAQLTKEMKTILDNSKGFIYFSLGSNAKTTDLSLETQKAIMETFSELPYAVFWKLDSDHFSNKPPNVFIMKWFPQQAILKHPKIKLFITQGGRQSIDEAIASNVPMIGLPFYADQTYNVQKMAAQGFGLSLSYVNLKKGEFKHAILEVIKNPKYRNTLKELSDLENDQPMTGLERALWWTEYVLRHRGAKHLRSPYLDVPLYQYLLLDVLGVCLLVIVVVVYVIVKREVVPLAQGLCQDCHPEVRSAICTQIPYIVQGLGTTMLRGDLLASLVELGSDDNMYVRSASVSAIVHIFPYTSLDVKKTTLLPLIKQLCDKALKHDDLTATTIAKEIGKILDGLQYSLTVPECLWFLTFYKRLSTKGLNNDEFKGSDASMDVTCRQQAAVNFPAMTSFVYSTIPTQIDSLYSTFKDLAGDPCFIVRKTIAGCIHEIIRLYDSNSKILKSDFVRLLQDDSEEVLYSLIPHLGTTLELLCEFQTLSRVNVNPATLEIGRALLKCQYELTTRNNWRLSTMFLHQFERLPNCMPSDFIHQHFTPILLTCAAKGRARPVRVQAVRTLLIFLRYNGKEMQRRWIRENLVAQLCRSDSYYTRLIYIKLCAAAMDIFSDNYFKEYFYQNLLDLAVDPVANIRLCIVNMIMSLKQMLILPDDKQLTERFNTVLKRYTDDEKDRDVIKAFQLKTKEMKTYEVNKEEYKKEQKRRRDEEDRINSGAKVSVLLLPKKETSRFTTINRG
ncbi:hypothetical protein RN001_015162 [Aquatica leii]|uniref:UDP-glucuronosyltransferase n=1 Tax=Aquatica leii TaxID=1421715 RepID=A0AAN7SL02_9COLE|nr:hypothetical protein RN001_015162 [Aquatica leii]